MTVDEELEKCLLKHKSDPWHKFKMGGGFKNRSNLSAFIAALRSEGVGPLSMLFGIIFFTLINNALNRAFQESKLTPLPGRSVWLWDKPTPQASEFMATPVVLNPLPFLDWAKNHGVTQVWIDPFFPMTSKKSWLSLKFQEFCKLAGDRRIRIGVIVGSSPHLVLPQHQSYLFKEILKPALALVSSVSENRPISIITDIEPHVLTQKFYDKVTDWLTQDKSDPLWENGGSERALIIKHFVETIQEMKQTISLHNCENGQGTSLVVTVAWWYLKPIAPPSFNGDALGAYIQKMGVDTCVMAYVDPKSVVKHSEPWVDQATKAGRSCWVTVETLKIEPKEGWSYFNLPKQKATELEKDLTSFTDELDSYAGFASMAVHHAESWKNL